MRSLYGVIGMPLSWFKTEIWRPLCRLFGRHGCFVFFKFTFASGVFARAGMSASAIARLLNVGLAFVKKIRKYTEIPPRLITQPGRKRITKCSREFLFEGRVSMKSVVMNANEATQGRKHPPI